MPAGSDRKNESFRNARYLPILKIKKHSIKLVKPKKMSTGSPSNRFSPFIRILIGVTTTVLGATLVYILGINKGPDSSKEKKKATLEAWESLMTYENSFKNAGTILTCSGDLSEIGNNIINEYEMIIGSITNIKEEKKEWADNRVISLIDRRLGTLKEKKNATAAYYDQLNVLDQSGLAQEELDKQIIALQNDFTAKMASLENRDTVFMNDVRTALNKKYKSDFQVSKPFLISPGLLHGNWMLDREIKIRFKKDQSFEWENGQQTISGKWLLEDLDLEFQFSDSDIKKVTITNGNQKFLLLKSTDDGIMHILCRE
jgi:hypothetical protein